MRCWPLASSFSRPARRLVISRTRKVREQFDLELRGGRQRARELLSRPLRSA